MIWWREVVGGVRDSNMEEEDHQRAAMKTGKAVDVVVAMGYVVRRDRGERRSGIDIHLGDGAVMEFGEEGFRILTAGMGRRLLEVKVQD